MGQKRLVSPLINKLTLLTFSLIEKPLFTLEVVRLHIFEHIVYENMCVSFFAMCERIWEYSLYQQQHLSGNI